MAGANKILKQGDVLFQAGDKSEGMYVIRKGELQVFLKQGDKEVVLAQVPAGSIVGEMAFFESKPRSASVKASQDCEVTLITNADFSKLLKQIPKWFVSLMEALSGRLRTTNERLQRIESGKPAHQVSPLFTTMKMLNILVLVWTKYGSKDDRTWILDREVLNRFTKDIFGEAPEKMGKLLEALAAQKLVTLAKDKFGKVGLSTANIGALERFGQFATEWQAKNPNERSMSEQALNILDCFQKIVAASAYDSVTASFADIQKEGARVGLETKDWDLHMRGFKPQGEAVALTKTGQNQLGLRTSKKDIVPFITNHRVLAAIAKIGLD